MASPGVGERRIITITSAPGWGALYTEADDVDAEPRFVTLAAWALVDDGAQGRLVGLVQRSDAGTFGLADEVSGFAGYSHRGLRTRPPVA
jgi:hypothetical protein